MNMHACYYIYLQLVDPRDVVMSYLKFDRIFYSNICACYHKLQLDIQRCCFLCCPVRRDNQCKRFIDMWTCHLQLVRWEEHGNSRLRPKTWYRVSILSLWFERHSEVCFHCSADVPLSFSLFLFRKLFFWTMWIGLRSMFAIFIRVFYTIFPSTNQKDNIFSRCFRFKYILLY